MDPEKKSLNFIFPTKYVIPKRWKFSHWPSKFALNGGGLKTGRSPHQVCGCKSTLQVALSYFFSGWKIAVYNFKNIWI